jgi:hypothetical protein
VEEALSDLNRAIELSGGRGKATEQALTQRGIIWRVTLREVVQLNPYSALCNRMLTEPIGKLYTQWRDLK